MMCIHAPVACCQLLLAVTCTCDATSTKHVAPSMPSIPQKLPDGSTLEDAGLLSPRPFAQLLWSLARLGRYPGSEVLQAAHAAILHRGRRCSGRAVGNVLYALAVFDALTTDVLLAAAAVLWEQLQEEEREAEEGANLWDSQLFLYMQVGCDSVTSYASVLHTSLLCTVFPSVFGAALHGPPVCRGAGAASRAASGTGRAAMAPVGLGHTDLPVSCGAWPTLCSDTSCKDYNVTNTLNRT